MKINLKNIISTGTDEEIKKVLDDINLEMMNMYKKREVMHVVIDNKVCIEKIHSIWLDCSNIFRYKKINNVNHSRPVGFMCLKILIAAGSPEVSVKFDPQTEYIKIKHAADGFILEINVKKMKYV